MINKKYYCNICDKCFSNKSSHKKTKLHTELSLSVVKNYYISDIPMNEIDNIINKHIYNYEKIFHIFDCWCIIQNEYFREKNRVIWHIVPDIIKIQEKIIRRYNCGQDVLVYIEIIFITALESATYSHYFNLPKPMIERKMCQIIDRNPKLIKTLDHMPKPYKKHVIIKHWGIRHIDDYGNIFVFVPDNWMDLEPNI